MKRTLIACILLLTGNLCKAQLHSKYIEDSIVKLKKYDSLIVWDKNRKLTFKDFQGNQNNISGTNAETAYSLILIYEDYPLFQAKIVCVFDKKKSWAKPDLLSEYILTHEQGHFDLAEVYARKMTKQLNDISIYDGDINKNIEKIYEHILRELDEMQNNYDNDTSNKVDKEKQKEWCDKIYLLLNKIND